MVFTDRVFQTLLGIHPVLYVQILPGDGIPYIFLFRLHGRNGQSPAQDIVLSTEQAFLSLQKKVY